MTIDLRSHFFEGTKYMRQLSQLSPSQRREHKIKLWNHFVDSDLIGLTDEDCGIIPRFLPLSYLKEIKKTAYQITLFTMRLLDLPTKELKSILPHGPIRDFLIEELEVLKYRPQLRVGSFRFDMALTGEACKGNPPKLLEINDIGFGGISRSTFLQNSMLNLMPQWKNQIHFIDAAKAECRNYLCLGHHMARFQYDAYDWEEQVLLSEAKRRNIQIELLSPKQLKFNWEKDHYPLLESAEVGIKSCRVIINNQWHPDFIQMGYSFELQDFLRAPQLYHSIVKSQTPQYSPFLTGLVASKSILTLLADPLLRRQLLGSSKKLNDAILFAQSLDKVREVISENYSHYVLKHVDGLGGEKVFFDDELKRQVKKVHKTHEHEWIAQERIKLNTIELEGTLSTKRKLIADLGVFVQYQWSQGQFKHFELGGFITRATNKSYKVNVSGGGIQVPVFFDKAA